MKSRYTIIETHPKVLQQKQKNEIVEVGLDAFGQEMTDREILDHVLPMHRAYLAYVGAQKNVMGFATAQLDPASVDFSIAVHTKAQQNGIYGDLLIRISDLALNTQRQMLTFRAQNPVILKGLRGSLDRLVNIALPRIKDFRGLSPKGFDKFGNYTFGVKEHIIFPEVSFERADKVRGLDIVVVIKAKNKEHSFALLEKMNFPFIKKGDN